MRRLATTLPTAAFAILAALVPSPARADAGAFVGLRVGYYTDAEEPFVGGEALLKMTRSVYFNPNVEYVLAENVDYFTFNADFHYDFPSHGGAFAWLGAGLGVVSVDPDGPGEGETDAAVNFLVGVGLSHGPVIPYFQAKVIAKDDSEFVFAFGLRF